MGSMVGSGLTCPTDYTERTAMTYRSRGQARSADQVEARKKVQRGTHDLVLIAQGDLTAPEVAGLVVRFVRWWEDLRRGKLPVYGSLLRFIDVSVALGTPRAMLLRIPSWLAWYINDRCDERSRRTGRMTGEHRPAA